MKNIKNTSLIVGFIVVAVTLLIFFVGVPDGKSAVDYVALLFIVIAELACFLLPYFLKNNCTENTVLTPILYVYATVAILFSLLFKSFFANNISAFVTIHIVFIAITAVSCLLFGKLLNDTLNNEAEAIMQMAVIDECVSLANILYQDERFAEHKDLLEKIYEELKYNDHVSDYKSGEILDTLNEIYSSEDNSNTETLCKKTIRLVNERNIAVKQLKRGGF